MFVKLMVSGGITKDGMSRSKVDPCVISSLRVKANLVLCVQCSKRIHSRYAGEKSVTKNFFKILLAGNMKGILERMWSRKKSHVIK